MNIAVPATSSPDVVLSDFDEINVRYTERHKEEDFINFCQEIGLTEKRVNISFDKDEDIILAWNMSKYVKNLHVRLSFEQLEYKDELEKYGVKYFFDYYVDSYIKLRYFISFTKTTDLYISDDLFYNLKEVSELCHELGINIRMILNRIPSNFCFAGMLYDSPIYRPQDRQFLEQYIDTVEFDCYENDGYYNWTTFKILYKRWFKDETWNMYLSTLNDDVKFKFPNDRVALGYSQFRSNCRHRCLERGFKCSKCNRFIQQAIADEELVNNFK